MHRFAIRRTNLSSSQTGLVSKRSLRGFPSNVKMASSSSQAPKIATQTPPIHLIVDFDGTLTRKDTMHLVAGIGYSRQEELDRKPQPRPWQEIVDAYMSDFQNHANQYAPKAADRTSLQQEVTWSNSLKAIEDASFNRAQQAGIFDNLKRTNIQQSVRVAVETGAVQMRNGWTELFSHICHHNAQSSAVSQTEGSISVLSVNWSKHFIDRVLRECASKSCGSNNAESLLSENKITIYANELPSVAEEDARIQSSGKNQIFDSKFPIKIQTSGDKAEIMDNIILSSAKSKRRSISVYIGDSSTDLQCLVAADFGICIRDEPVGSGQRDLAKTCGRVGIEVKRLDSQTSLDNVSPPQDCLFWVKDFTEIKQWFVSQPIFLNAP